LQYSAITHYIFAISDVSNIVLTGTLLISQDKILIVMLYYNFIFNNVFLFALINNIMTSTTTKPTIDSSTNWSTITGVEIIGNSHESQNNYRVVSSIVKQVAGKKIWISLHRLLEIVKPEVRQDIINSIKNPDISRRNRTPCKAKKR